jgi:hypothetical protein
MQTKTTQTEREIDNPETPMTWSKCFASRQAGTIIDVVHPVTGLTCCYGRDLANVRQEYPDAELMTVDDWCKAKAATQDTPITTSEVTREQYWEMLEVLPPACMLGGGFLVGEPMDHHAGNGQPRFSAYFQVGNRYLVASRPLTIREFKTMLSHKSASVTAELEATA